MTCGKSLLWENNYSPVLLNMQALQPDHHALALYFVKIEIVDSHLFWSTFMFYMHIVCVTKVDCGDAPVVPSSQSRQIKG